MEFVQTLKTSEKAETKTHEFFQKQSKAIMFEQNGIPEGACASVCVWGHPKMKYSI